METSVVAYAAWERKFESFALVCVFRGRRGKDCTMTVPTEFR